MTTQLHVTALGLPGVLLLKSIVHADARGSFTQSWQAADWRAAGVDIAFMQDNLVCNARCSAGGFPSSSRLARGSLSMCQPAMRTAT